MSQEGSAMEQELLQAISDLANQMNNKFEWIDAKLEQIDTRFDALEYKINRNAKKLDDLQLHVTLSKREIQNNIHKFARPT